MSLVTVSIKETAPGCWRVTFNRKVMGDSRGYDKRGAIEEAIRAVKRGGGHWQGETWVDDTWMLDPSLRR